MENILFACRTPTKYGWIPEDITSSIQDPMIRDKIKDDKTKTNLLTLEEKEENQKKYETNKNEKFQVGSYVFPSDVPKTKFTKSSDLKVNIT